MITRVYIDGFNLYHGLIQGNRAHWLDLSSFAVRLNRGLPVDKVLYSTALVSGTPKDRSKPDRQDGCLRALAIACPNVEVVLGIFTTHRKLYPLAKCSNDPTCGISVAVRTEKGSDVNLATRLVHDAHLGKFTRAIVVSGDSNLVEPIRIVAGELGKTVWVRNPRDHSSKELEAVATHYDRIRPAVAIGCQLAEVVSDGVKIYSKPARWKLPPAHSAKREINRWECAQADCKKCVTTLRYEPTPDHLDERAEQE